MGNVINPQSIVVGILIILVGAVASGLLLAGTLSPTEFAKADGMIRQNPIEAERSKFVLEQDKQVAAAKTKAEIERIANESQYHQQLLNQRLAQQAQEIEQSGWIARCLAIGAAMALNLLAVGGILFLRSRATAVKLQAQAAQQLAHLASLIDQQNGVLLKTLGQHGALLGALQNESAQARKKSAEVLAQLAAIQMTLAQPPTHGDGSDTGGKIIPFKNVA